MPSTITQHSPNQPESPDRDWCECCPVPAYAPPPPTPEEINLWWRKRHFDQLIEDIRRIEGPLSDGLLLVLKPLQDELNAEWAATWQVP